MPPTKYYTQQGASRSHNNNYSGARPYGGGGRHPHYGNPRPPKPVQNQPLVLDNGLSVQTQQQQLLGATQAAGIVTAAAQASDASRKPNPVSGLQAGSTGSNWNVAATTAAGEDADRRVNEKASEEKSFEEWRLAFYRARHTSSAQSEGLGGQQMRLSRHPSTPDAAASGNDDAEPPASWGVPLTWPESNIPPRLRPDDYKIVWRSVPETPPPRTAGHSTNPFGGVAHTSTIASKPVPFSSMSSPFAPTTAAHASPFASVAAAAGGQSSSPFQQTNSNFAASTGWARPAATPFGFSTPLRQ